MSGHGISSLCDSLIPLCYLQSQHSSVWGLGEEPDQLPPSLTPIHGVSLTLAFRTQQSPTLGWAGLRGAGPLKAQAGKGVSSPRGQWGHILSTPQPPGPSRLLPRLRFGG